MCKQFVVVKRGKRNLIRKCKNKAKYDDYCGKHRKYEYPTIGQCCFCHGDCNEQSQACGRCARKMFF
jgi:hypothetical protein